ncbi:uncharacterized protein CLUP02_06075 [Colletotrichum lupini]|uniref:Uncharacterized protein n=1 Tax=Colletotrichum lupini TaxID=145971 RepID=A0A9Q8SNF4_9PEZI|nr:uncharacterized protein CLUP02_06075 [Colletotrichum lupini]UQC80592.1 hypothetical protein CLUP02_06075 [Colletotrichum lupini]
MSNVYLRSNALQCLPIRSHNASSVCGLPTLAPLAQAITPPDTARDHRSIPCSLCRDHVLLEATPSLFCPICLVFIYMILPVPPVPFLSACSFLFTQAIRLILNPTYPGRRQSRLSSVHIRDSLLLRNK